MTILFLLILGVFILFPFLILPILLFFALGFIFFLPYIWTFNSIYNIFTIPKQLYKIAREPNTRKNHSLEHATINVLEEIYGRPLRVGGVADNNGFSLSGPDLPMPFEVLAATREGQKRLMQGERELALHPRCGTSIAGANLLFSLVFVLVLLFYGHLSFLNAALAFLLSNFLAKPFGHHLQKWVTTHSTVEDIEILGIEIKSSQVNSPIVFLLANNKSYYISTRSW